MIYQWYTGSDETKSIAKEFEKVYFRSRGRLSTESIIRKIEELAQAEQDPNMRAKFLTAAARLRRESTGTSSSGMPMRELVKLYDPLAPNFPWVVSDYLEACLWAAIEAVGAEGDDAWLAAGPYFLALAVWYPGRLDHTVATWAIGGLAAVLLELGKKYQSRVLLELAVAAGIRAHHGDSEDARVLEVLAEAHRLLGDVGAEARVLRDLRELDPQAAAKAPSALSESFRTFLRLFGFSKT